MRQVTERLEINRVKSRYNLIPTISWSLLGFTPLGYFCYAYMEMTWLYVFLAFSLIVLFLPNSFFQFVRLSGKTSTYQKIGIRITKKLTQDGDLVNRSIERRFPGHKSFQTQNALERLVSRSYFQEKMHGAMFIFFLLTTVYAILHNFIAWALVITFTNIVFNIYPIFLQQYNRLRLHNITKRRNVS